MAKHWYVIHAHSGFEKNVIAAIRERAASEGLSDLLGEALSPSEEVVEVRRGKRVTSERKLFPGYILIQVDMSDEIWNLIKNTQKVSNFLGSGKKPSPISDKEADAMLQRINEDLERPRQAIIFEVGEQVRVCDGPFASFNGFVEDIDEEKSRLKVSVSIFGRATPVELEYGQVEKY